VGDELEVIWNTYYRVADPIFVLGDDASPSGSTPSSRRRALRAC